MRQDGCAGDGLVVTRSGVHLNLGGHTIRGLGDPATESRRWSALLAGAGWSYRFGGRFAIGLDVEGLLAVDRPEFVTTTDARLHQPAAAGLRLGCGLEVEIR